ncbi:endoribonuclease L-PSP [Komagataeibacter nataicola NRIC 0616]|nr:endoribonuclease L-PSP [Komagataeibacter nataicola NRIC 0616]
MHDVMQAIKAVSLPPVSTPRGSYTPILRSGEFVFVSGQGPRWGDELRYKGKVDCDLTVEQGQEAARLCALNIIAQLNGFLNHDLRRVQQVVRVAGVVRCADIFEKQALVMNGASDLFLEIFGERGRHVRIATGTSALPSGMAVEVEAMFRVI